MVERIAHFLTGWVEFEIRGNGARFLNGAAKTGIEFWGFSQREGRPVVRGRPREYRRLRPLFRRCGAHPRIRKRGGIPFFIRRLGKNPGVVLGIVCGAGIYLLLRGFCWGVTVTGTETLTQRQVLEAARENGVYVGALLSRLDPTGAALSLQNDLPGTSWLAVNTDGCFVEVALRESLPAPEVADSREWSNMVASQAGTIVSIQAERGRPEVSVGDTVVPGQLLIAGLYEQEADPYSPPPEEPYQVLGAARGSVRALTYREFTVEVSQLASELRPAGGLRKSHALEILGLQISLGFDSALSEESRTWSRRWSWAPLGRELPLTWVETTSQPLEEASVLLEEDAWREAALLRLRRLQREELPPGSQILREELSYHFENGMCTLTSQCRCEEEIGVVREISFE